MGTLKILTLSVAEVDTLSLHPRHLPPSVIFSIRHLPHYHMEVHNTLKASSPARPRHPFRPHHTCTLTPIYLLPEDVVLRMPPQVSDTRPNRAPALLLPKEAGATQATC
jgi:hypothetical protein